MGNDDKTTLRKTDREGEGGREKEATYKLRQTELVQNFHGISNTSATSSFQSRDTDSHKVLHYDMEHFL